MKYSVSFHSTSSTRHCLFVYKKILIQKHNKYCNSVKRMNNNNIIIEGHINITRGFQLTFRHLKTLRTPSRRRVIYLYTAPTGHQSPYTYFYSIHIVQREDFVANQLLRPRLIFVCQKNKCFPHTHKHSFK